MASPHDYVVYVFLRGDFPPGRPALRTKVDGHAGESETAHTMISRPDLVHMDRAAPSRVPIKTASIYRTACIQALVVRQVSRSLCRRWRTCNERTRGVRHEGVGHRSR